MSKSSTAKFIQYALRPAKQAERRILMDFLKCANEAGMTVSDCRYVGMGGTMFYDFHLMHRFLGVNQMISLERDPDTHPRSEFNCPFDFINVQNRTVADFLAVDSDDCATIYWTMTMGSGLILPPTSRHLAPVLRWGASLSLPYMLSLPVF
jgi:hypothetical protein